MVVAAGLTFAFGVVQFTVPTPLLIEQLVALVIPLHDKVDDCPVVIVGGFAVNEPIVGAGVGVQACLDRTGTSTKLSVHTWGWLTILLTARRRGCHQELMLISCTKLPVWRATIMH